MMTIQPKKRILIVDDSFIMRKLVSDLVSSDPDLEVVDTAEDGRIALQKVRECKPDLVLLDIEMPEMSGLETLRRLGLRSKTKVIILSSLGQEGTAETADALRLGAAAVLGKPSGSISLDLQARKGSEILRTIRNVLDLAPLVGDAEAVAEDGDASEASALPAPSDTRFQDLLLGALASGVLLFDASGRLTVANEAAGKLLGNPNLLAGGLTLDQIFDNYNEGLGADIREVLATGLPLAPTVTDYALEDGSWLPIRLAAMPLPQAGGSNGVLVLLDDMSREQEVKKILARTLSEDVATKLLSGGKLSLGGTSEKASILFSDIRSFTNLSEELGAAGVVEMLNEYFSFMEDILKGNGGVVDKYIGDAIMALFGVPAKLGKDADRAVKAGLDMLAALEVLNKDRAARGQKAIAIGVGVSTGEVIAGNIGSPTRMNYTVIGDTVNLASRIESLTKQYGAEFLICGETMAALSEPVQARKVDLVRVKGQTAAVVLYQVFRPEPLLDPAWLQAYSAGFEAYAKGEWDVALGHLAKVLTLRPDDKAAALVSERCRILRATPPTSWDGVWTHQEK
jgi:adenylate cyclase